MKNLEKCKTCIHYRLDGPASSRKCIECVNDQGRMPWYTPRPAFSIHAAPPTDPCCGVETAPCAEPRIERARAIPDGPCGEDPIIVRVPCEEASSLCEEAARPCGGSSGSVWESEPVCDPGDSDAPRAMAAIRTISEALGIPAGVACADRMCEAAREAATGPDLEDAERIVDRYRGIEPILESIAGSGCSGSYDPGCGGGH